MDNLLIDLINSYGVSGRENEIRKLIELHLNKNKIKFYEDKINNIIVKKGSGKNKLMICSHIDSAGFIVESVNQDGTIVMDSIGKFKKQYVENGFIRFENGTLGKISSCKTNITADIGMNNRDDVLNKISEGETASLIGPYLIAGNNSKNIISPLLHNKVGCYVLLKLIEKLENYNEEVYFVFSSQGEIGGVGARAAACDIKPDYAIVVGTKDARTVDNINENVSIEKGPVLRILDNSIIMHRDIKQMLEKAAEKSDVKIQYSIGGGKSEGELLHKEFSGIPSGEIDIPCRYKYSISEMISMNDVDDTIELLKNML